MERRLAAILAADVVGYSKLMGIDEAGTLSELSRLIKEFIEPLIAEHNGRIVKFMGDGILAEFGSVVDAVTCAIAWQGKVTEKNSNLLFRIGINLGEIIIQDDDIFGNGVNIAARLEALANAGSICVSDDVYRQAKGKVESVFEDIGEQQLKNIDEPVRVYRVLTGPDSGSGALRHASSKKFVNRAAAVAAVIVVAIGTALWQQTSGPEPTLQVTAKPSIAVLPFTNSNSETKDDFFSEGISNDIIIDLSKFQNLLVSASNSVSAYKGKTVDVKMVSRELDVRYILEGNVLRRGERVRINVQLTDGTTGQHLWAERYDRAADNIWDIQDEITGRIVRTLAVRITEIEEQRVLAKSTENLEDLSD